jgi:hypothetical protein
MLKTFWLVVLLHLLEDTTMNRRTIGLIRILALGLLRALLAADVPQLAKVHRIGFLRAAAPPKAYIHAFLQGLKELGYHEERISRWITARRTGRRIASPIWRSS